MKLLCHGKAAGTGGSRLGLKTGDKITLKDLLYGLMLRSGNDAAVAIAEHIGGDVPGFIALMNQKADEMGLVDTHFVTPHGLDDPEHYTTAYELALMSCYALDIPIFHSIVKTKTYTVVIDGSAKDISNTNELLGVLTGVDGVKTGFTNNAGRCLVTSVTRDNFDIICVVLGADTKRIRTKDSAALIEYCYKKYELINIGELLEKEFKIWCDNNVIEVNKGRNNVISLSAEKLAYNVIPIKKDDIKDIEIDIRIEKYLEAPVLEEQKLGEIDVKIDDEVLFSTNVTSKEKIPKKNPLEYFYYLLTNMEPILEKQVK